MLSFVWTGNGHFTVATLNFVYQEKALPLGEELFLYQSCAVYALHVFQQASCLFEGKVLISRSWHTKLSGDTMILYKHCRMPLTIGLQDTVA